MSNGPKRMRKIIRMKMLRKVDKLAGSSCLWRILPVPAGIMQAVEKVLHLPVKVREGLKEELN